MTGPGGRSGPGPVPILVGLWFLAAAGAAPAPDDPAGPVLDRIRNRAGSIRSLSGVLEICRTSAGEDGGAARARFEVLAPNRLRARPEVGADWIVVSDGTTVWDVDHHERTCARGSPGRRGEGLELQGDPHVSCFLDASPGHLSLPGGGPFLHRGTVRRGSRTFDVIEQDARDPTTGLGSVLTLEVGPDDLIHRRIVARFEDGRVEPDRVTSSILRDVVIDPSLDPEIFRFEVPGGYVAPGSRLSPLIAPGDPAPAFDLPVLGGGRIRLTDAVASSRAVLLVFWNWNCPPCRQEFPHLERLRADLAGNGFTILGINQGDPEDRVTRFVSGTGVGFPILLAPGDHPLFAEYRVESFPTNYLLDSEGRVQHAGRVFDLPALRRALARLGIGPAGERGPDATSR